VRGGGIFGEWGKTQGPPKTKNWGGFSTDVKTPGKLSPRLPHRDLDYCGELIRGGRGKYKGGRKIPVNS